MNAYLCLIDKKNDLEKKFTPKDIHDFYFQFSINPSLNHEPEAIYLLSLNLPSTPPSMPSEPEYIYQLNHKHHFILKWIQNLIHHFMESKKFTCLEDLIEFLPKDRIYFIFLYLCTTSEKNEDIFWIWMHRWLFIWRGDEKSFAWLKGEHSLIKEKTHETEWKRLNFEIGLYLYLSEKYKEAKIYLNEASNSKSYEYGTLLKFLIELNALSLKIDIEKLLGLKKEKELYQKLFHMIQKLPEDEKFTYQSLFIEKFQIFIPSQNLSVITSFLQISFLFKNISKDGVDLVLALIPNPTLLSKETFQYLDSLNIPELTSLFSNWKFLLEKDNMQNQILYYKYKIFTSQKCWNPILAKENLNFSFSTNATDNGKGVIYLNEMENLNLQMTKFLCSTNGQQLDLNILSQLHNLNTLIIKKQEKIQINDIFSYLQVNFGSKYFPEDMPYHKLLSSFHPFFLDFQSLYQEFYASKSGLTQFLQNCLYFKWYEFVQFLTETDLNDFYSYISFLSPTFTVSTTSGSNDEMDVVGERLEMKSLKEQDSLGLFIMECIYTLLLHLSRENSSSNSETAKNNFLQIYNEKRMNILKSERLHSLLNTTFTTLNLKYFVESIPLCSELDLEEWASKESIRLFKLYLKQYWVNTLVKRKWKWLLLNMPLLNDSIDAAISKNDAVSYLKQSLGLFFILQESEISDFSELNELFAAVFSYLFQLLGDFKSLVICSQYVQTELSQQRVEMLLNAISNQQWQQELHPFVFRKELQKVLWYEYKKPLVEYSKGLSDYLRLYFDHFLNLE